MNKKLNFILKLKKSYKIILYLFLSFVIIFLVYFSVPNFFNYSPRIIEESLKKNSNFNIKNISNIKYKLFPTPRLRLLKSNLKLEENVLEIEDAEVYIILNPLNIINYQKLDYNSLLIKGGSTNIEINKVNQLFNYIKKNKKKIIFKKNKILLLQKKKKILEINNSEVKTTFKNNTQQLNINGFFLNHEIFFILKNKFKNKKDITLKIPELDILASILSEEKNNLKSVEGLVNLAVLNNFFQFNFIKEKNIIIKKGFIRNNLVISSYEGEISIKPHFQFNLNVEPSKLNIKKLFLIIQKNFFLEDSQGFEVIKKINGVLNFKTIFQGSIVFKNKEILFQNIKIGRTTPIIFDAKISQLGKKKIEFNVLKNIQYKENHTKELKISGFIVPSSSKVVFEQILFDKKILTDIETKGYEERFKNVVIKNSLNNLFDESKLDDFFKNIVN